MSKRDVHIFEGENIADINRQIKEWRSSSPRIQPVSLHFAPLGERAAVGVVYEMVEEKINTPKPDDYTNLLFKFGIPPHFAGFRYIKTGLVLLKEDYGLISAVTKAFYPAIAEKHNTTANKVERAIRHAIEVGWNNGKMKTFGLWSEHPTNSMFFASIIESMDQLKAS